MRNAVRQAHAVSQGKRPAARAKRRDDATVDQQIRPVHRADGAAWQTMPFASGVGTRTCDLKKLQGQTDVLGVGPLAADHTQVRLVVSSANIYFDNASSGPACAPTIAAPAGKSAPVDVPSGEVKLNHEFTITASATTMLLDFDG